jgi:hypothetical protein
MVEVRAQAVSLNPKTFTSGGILNDRDVKVLKAWFSDERPDGYNFDSTFLYIVFGLDDDTETTQFWGTGKAGKFRPSEDKKRILPNGEKSTLESNSNAALFFASLITNGGMPEGQLDTEECVNSLVGAEFHVMRFKVSGREDLAAKSAEEKKGDGMVLMCSGPCLRDKQVHWPWDKKGSTSPSKKSAASIPTSKPQSASTVKPATDSPASSPSNSELSDDTLSEFVAAALNANGGTLPLENTKQPVKAFGPQVFIKIGSKLTKEARAKAIERASDEGWLNDHGFMIEDGMVTALPV